MVSRLKALRPSHHGFRFLEEELAPDESPDEPLTVKTPNTFSDGQTAHLAIRPEKVTITADRPESADNAVQGKILDIAYLGNISTYHVELPSGAVIKAQAANTRRISRRAFTWEDTVWLSWTATAGVLLAN